MKWFLLAILLVSNVYGSEELLQCYDGCLNIFRYETNIYPDMPRERLMALTDATKRCCAECDYKENVRLSFIASLQSCHRQCVDVYNDRMYKAKTAAEQMDITEETKGCHLHCDFIADLKRGSSR